MCDDATLAGLNADLAAMRAAKTRLMSGQAVTQVWSGDDRVTYSAVRMSDLNAEIDAIEKRIADCAAQREGRPRRRAIGVSWLG